MVEQTETSPGTVASPSHISGSAPSTQHPWDPWLTDAALKERAQADQDAGNPSISKIDLSALAPEQKSWGDRFKKATYNIGTYFGINYVVNTIISVALAYKFELKFSEKLNEKAHAFGDMIARKVGGSAQKIGNAVYMGVRGGTLTFGGTSLLPVIEMLENHKRNVEFRLGHGLDVLQQALGQGNETTSQNIADYKKIIQDRKDPGSVEFTAEEKQRLWEKHRLEFTSESHTLRFREHKLPWTSLIAARAAAWVAAIATNSGLGYIGVKQRLKDASPKVTSGVSKLIPGYSKLQQPTMFTENILNDGILTVASSVTHKFVQGKMHEDIPDMAPVEPDEVRQLEGRPTPGELRKKILAEGKQDYRSRADASARETSHALS